MIRIKNFNLKKRLINQNFFFLTLLFLSLSITQLVPNKSYIYSERGFIEIIQLLIIFQIIFIQIVEKKILKKYFKVFGYYFRLILWSLIFYEEISFLTFSRFKFTSIINSQSELNLHNLYFLKNLVLSNFPIFEGVQIKVILISLILFLFGFGTQIKYIKEFKFLLLEKKFSFYTLIFFFNLLISGFLRHYKIIQGQLINLEFIELFLYLLVLFDLFEKIKRIKLNIKDNT